MKNQSRTIDRRTFVGMLGAGALSLALAGCGGSNDTDDTPAQDEASSDTAGTDESTKEARQQADPTGSAGNAAVVYFSWSGNTRSMAERIAQLSSASVFELVPETAYPEEYNACTDEALAEQKEGTLRPYKGDVDGWDSIDTVFLGYPIWWMDLPQVIKSFIADHDWTGKTVVPFSTYFSSGWAGTPDKIAEACTGATMAEGLSLGQNDLPGAYDQVDGWLAGLAL